MNYGQSLVHKTRTNYEEVGRVFKHASLAFSLKSLSHVLLNKHLGHNHKTEQITDITFQTDNDVLSKGNVLTHLVSAL